MATRPRKRRTLPRRRWTNPLAWAVWNQRRLNKIRHDGGIIPPPDCRYYYSFDGVDDYISVSGVNLGSDFEIHFSFSAVNVLDQQWIYSDWDDDAVSLRSVAIRVLNNELQTFISQDGGNVVVGATSLISPNTDYRCIMAFNNQTITLSVNEVTSTPVLTPVTSVFNSGNSIKIASKNGVSSFFEGVIYNLKITKSGALIRSYAIDDNSNTIIDSVGGQNGTLINGDPASWEYICESTALTADTTNVTADDTTHTADEG